MLIPNETEAKPCLNAVESEIRLFEKRAQNLMTRLADLPPDIPADTIYGQLREINVKQAEAKATKAKLTDEKYKYESKELDQDALRARVQRAVQVLAKTPIENQKAVFENLFQFIELHPPGPFFVSFIPALHAGSTAVCYGA